MPTPTKGSPRRVSEFAEFFTGHAVPVGFRFAQRINGRTRPIDLTQYSDVKLFIYDNESDPTARQVVPLEVLDDDADKVLDIDGTTLVAAKCRATVIASGAQGNVICKVLGISAGVYTLLGEPWEAGVYLGGPTS